MQRIAVIGCGGGGKSSVARRLGAALGLPVIHLDDPFHHDAWRPLPQEAFAALRRGLVAAPGRVIDGNYASTLPLRLAAADTVVVFLDLPAATCLWGIAQRRVRHGGAQRRRITTAFIRNMWWFRRTMHPRVLRLIAGHAQVITLPLSGRLVRAHDEQ